MAAAIENVRSIGQRVIWPSRVRPLLARAARAIAGHPSRATILGALEEADLPPTLRQLISVVVRHARLRRREQLDVTRELVAHFRDGLAQGALPDDLQRSFGDPRAAARLIRRAKVRCRPLWWQAWRWGLRGAALLLLCGAGLYIVLSLQYHLSYPTISHDYVAEYNARILAAPDTDRAWPLYREAIIALEPLPEQLADRWPIEYTDDQRWIAGRDYLRRNTHAIELAHRAGSRPLLGAMLGDPLSERTLIERTQRHSTPQSVTIQAEPPADPSLIGSPLPFLTPARELTRLLRADVTAAIEDGDSDRILRDLDTLVKIARHAEQGGFLLSTIIALSIDQVTFDGIKRALAESPELLTTDQWRQIAHSVAASGDAGDRLASALRSERDGFLDFVQRVYSDDGAGDGRLTARGVAFLTRATYQGSGPSNTSLDEAMMPLLAGTALSRRELINRYDHLMRLNLEEMARPLWATPSADLVHACTDPDASLYQRARNWPTSLMVPMLAHVARQAHHHRAQRDATLTAIALEIHRREHGSYPSTLAALTPRLLPRIPIDPADGQPLRYRVSEHGAVLYSIGADGADDSGVPPARGNLIAMPGVSANAAAAAEDLRRPVEGRTGCLGDWVLYPVPRPPRNARPQS